MNTKDIIKSLDVVKPALEKPGSLLSYFNFKDNKVFANNLELSIESNCVTDLNIALPGELLYKFLLTIDADVFFKEEKTIVEIVTEDKKIVNRLQGLDNKDFPSIPDTLKRLDIFVIDKLFISALQNVINFSSDDPLYPQYGGIFLADNFVYATNGVFMAKYPLKMRLKKDLFLPKSFCLEVIRLHTQLDKIEIYEDLILAKGENTKITHLLPDITFPNCKDLFKQYVANLGSINFIKIPDKILQSIYRLLLISTNLYEKICTIRFKKNLLELELDNKCNSFLKEQFDIENTVEEDLCIDIKFFEQCVKSTDKFAILGDKREVFFFENENGLQVLLSACK